MQTRRTSPGPKRAAAFVVASLMLLAATACGDDDTDAGGSADASTPAVTATATSSASAASPAVSAVAAPTMAPPSADVDPDGVLRIGISMTNFHFDPANPVPPSVNNTFQTVLYDTLLRSTGGVLAPGLASAVEAVDEQTVRITLHDGLRFTDGTPLDAEAAKASIQYIIDSQSGSLDLERKLIQSMTVEDPLTLTLHLNAPGAGGLIVALGGSTFLLPSPTAIAGGVDLKTQPVGAGPFMLEEFQNGQFARLVKNPDYFQADSIRLAGLEFHHLDAGQSTVNALLSGAVDVADNISYEQAQQLSGATMKVEAETSDNLVLWAYMCKNRAPFDDVRVRQALNHAIDRQALIDTVFDGNGKPAWGFFPEGSRYFAPELADYYEYDPNKARALLAEAGQSNLSFDSYFTAPGSRAAEVMQAQLNEIGVTMRLQSLARSSDFFPDALLPMNVHLLERSWVQKVSRGLEPGSVSNVCQWNDPELLTALADVRAAEPDSPEAVEAWGRLSKRALDTAVFIFIAFAPAVRVWNDDRVGNPTFMDNYAGKPVIDFHEVYIKA